MDYRLTVYRCEGEPTEKLDWFRTINIAGEKLTDQEMRNAVYAGKWTADAKRYFSKTNCPAFGLASNLLTGTPIRQDYPETAIKWKSKGDINLYMAKNQHVENALELWEYFTELVSWVNKTFKNYRREMKGVDWGPLFDKYGKKRLAPTKIEKEIVKLMMDEDVTKKSGIYPYILTRKEKYLSIRQFTEKQRREAYERQKGVCPTCSKKFEFGDMEADHINPWHSGGKTTSDNCQMLCKEDNRVKSGK